MDEAAQGRSSSYTYVVATIQAPEIDNPCRFAHSNLPIISSSTNLNLGTITATFVMMSAPEVQTKSAGERVLECMETIVYAIAIRKMQL